MSAVARTAFVFPGLNSAGHVAEDPTLVRRPGFAARWQLCAAAFAEAPGFASFAHQLLHGEALPTHAATWPWRALAVTAMQLAVAEELEQDGERADWLCGYSIGEVARSCHAGAFSFAQLVAFARALPPLPIASGTTAAVQGASVARVEHAARSLAGAGVHASRLSPRFLMVAGPDAAMQRALAALGSGLHVQAIAACALHTPLQLPLALRLAAALAGRRLPLPRAGVFSTLLGRPLCEGDDCTGELAANVAEPCDFATTIRRLHQDHGVTRFVDLGPGRHAQRFVRHHGRGLVAVSAAELLALTARSA